MAGEENKYLSMINVTSATEAFERVKEFASVLTDDQHLIRSCILGLHAEVESKLKDVFYIILYSLLYFDDDEERNKVNDGKFNKMIDSLGFMQMYRILQPILASWPYDDLKSIQALNDTRNQVAHESDISKVRYKGRNPFSEADCFAQMFIDVFAIRQAMAEFIDHGVNYRATVLQRYVDKYGSELSH